jgi:hypothetical protein
MQSPVVGLAPIGFIYAPDTVQRCALGTLASGVDPFWGGGEFIYLKSNDTIICGSLVIWDLSQVATLAASTANQACTCAVAMMPAAAGTYFWAAVRADRVPMKATATVTAGATIGIGTSAGTASGTLVAGKQILGAKGVIASAGTVTYANTQTTNGSPVVVVQNADGLYPGIATSGTGIAASTVSSIAPDNRTVTLSANSTATGSVTMTGTHTGFVIAQINRCALQGAIT